MRGRGWDEGTGCAGQSWPGAGRAAQRHEHTVGSGTGLQAGHSRNLGPMGLGLGLPHRGHPWECAQETRTRGSCKRTGLFGKYQCCYKYSISPRTAVH